MPMSQTPLPFFRPPQFGVWTKTALGFPSGLKELRSGSSLQVEMDKVVQALMRSTCSDGFRAGFEAGFAAGAQAGRKAEGSNELAQRLEEASSQLKLCSNVRTRFETKIFTRKISIFLFVFSLKKLLSMRDLSRNEKKLRPISHRD